MLLHATSPADTTQSTLDTRDTTAPAAQALCDTRELQDWPRLLVITKTNRSEACGGTVAVFASATTSQNWSLREGAGARGGRGREDRSDRRLRRAPNYMLPPTITQTPHRKPTPTTIIINITLILPFKTSGTVSL